MAENASFFRHIFNFSKDFVELDILESALSSYLSSFSSLDGNSTEGYSPEEGRIGPSKVIIHHPPSDSTLVLDETKLEARLLFFF